MNIIFNTLASIIFYALKHKNELQKRNAKKKNKKWAKKLKQKKTGLRPFLASWICKYLNKVLMKQILLLPAATTNVESCEIWSSEIQTI